MDLSNAGDIQRRIKDAQTLALASLHPVAVLLHRELNNAALLHECALATGVDTCRWAPARA